MTLRQTPAVRRRLLRDEVQTARWALLGLFAVNGLTLSAWLARLPAMRDALDLTPAHLGAVLLAGSIGGLAMMTQAPRVVARLGHANAVRVFGSLFGIAYLVMGLAPAVGSVPILAVGLFLNGIALAANNLTINLGSAVVERRVGKPILSQFHAAFSIGTVVGSLAGAGAAGLSVPLLAQFVVLAAIAVGWRLLAAGAMLGEEPAATGPVGAGTSSGRSRPTLLATWREPRAVLIGAIILVAVASEFAANDWLALAMVDGRGSPESVAALVFALFVTSMTAVRLVGGLVLERFGRVAVLRGGAVVSIVGILLFVLAPNVPLAALGVVAWGAGSALNFPIAVSASSDDPARAGNRIAVLSMFASVAPLVESPGIGLLAEHVGVRYALLAIAVALLFIVVTARQVARAPVGAEQEGAGTRGGTPIPADDAKGAERAQPVLVGAPTARAGSGATAEAAA